MPNIEYAPNIIDQIMAQLKASLGTDFFKLYFYGNPDSIPQSQMPALLVNLTDTTHVKNTTGTDLYRHTVDITIVLNKKDEYNNLSNTGEVTMKRYAENIIHGIDKVTGEPSQHSIVGILRKHFTLSNTVTDQRSRVRFALQSRRAQESTVEATLTVAIDQIFVVSSPT